MTGFSRELIFANEDTSTVNHKKQFVEVVFCDSTRTNGIYHNTGYKRVEKPEEVI